MANELKGKLTASITWFAPNDIAAEALKDFFVGTENSWKRKAIRMDL